MQVLLNWSIWFLKSAAFLATNIFQQKEDQNLGHFQIFKNPPRLKYNDQKGHVWVKPDYIVSLSNMQSTSLRSSMIGEFLSAELKAGRVLGPVGPGPAASIQVNWFGLVPKGHQPHKWWMMVNLFFPDGRSVDDGIDTELCSLHYTSVDTACCKVLFLGQGATLAKFDVLGAFQTIPVHPHNCWLLGMHWVGCIYVGEVLPFSLHSAPRLYNAIADGLLWSFCHRTRWKYPLPG